MDINKSYEMRGVNDNLQVFDERKDVNHTYITTIEKEESKCTMMVLSPHPP